MCSCPPLPNPPLLSSLFPSRSTKEIKKKKKKKPHTMPPSSVVERPTTPSRAGITVTADGRQIIPSSIRADGSARREILVRPGYRPPEDVEVYKNRNAEAWKNRGSGGVPGAAPVEKKPDVTQTGASLKNAKRKARKKAKESESRADGAKEHGAKENEARRNETSGKEAGEGRPASRPEPPLAQELPPPRSGPTPPRSGATPPRSGARGAHELGTDCRRQGKAGQGCQEEDPPSKRTEDEARRRRDPPAGAAGKGHQDQRAGQTAERSGI